MLYQKKEKFNSKDVCKGKGQISMLEKEKLEIYLSKGFLDIFLNQFSCGRNRPSFAMFLSTCSIALNSCSYIRDDKVSGLFDIFVLFPILKLRDFSLHLLLCIPVQRASG